MEWLEIHYLGNSQRSPCPVTQASLLFREKSTFSQGSCSLKCSFFLKGDSEAGVPQTDSFLEMGHDN